MGIAPLLRLFGWNGILFKCSLLSAKVATSPRNHHGVQVVTVINVLVFFYPLIDVNQRGLTGDANYGLWRCSTIADVSGEEPLRSSSCRSDDCGIVRLWIAFHPWTEFAPWLDGRRSQHRSANTLVVSRQKLNPLELDQGLGLIRARYQFHRQFFAYTVEFCWTRFSTSWRFLVVFSVRFLPLLGRSPVWPSSRNRLMELLTFGGATPSFRAMSQLLAYVTPKFCLVDWHLRKNRSMW